MRSRVLSANVLSESSESEHVQKALHSGILKALELVESYPDLCNNKNMPKSTVRSVWGKSINQAALFVFNDTICLSFQPKRKIFQSESMEKYLRAEKGSTEWDVDRGKLKILSGKNIWRCYTAAHLSSPPRPQWKQTLVLRDSLMLPCSFWREIWLGGGDMYPLGFSVWVCVGGDSGSLLSHSVSVLLITQLNWCRKGMVNQHS